MNKDIFPQVVIVGRTNVGKSTLFNRLSVSVKSIALDREGVTRDFIKDIVEWQGYSFELVDTGGISLRKTQDEILEATRQRALTMLEGAAVVLFVVDGTIGILPEDREITRLIHRLGKKTFLVVNKLDTHLAQGQLHEFQQLGYPDIIPISAQHGTGIADLLEGIVGALTHQPEKIEVAVPQCRVVVLGKPNVGKSSLLNLLVKKERAIVADMPGTTREPISECISFYKDIIQVTDTPGVRKKRSVTDTLETMMVKTAMGALRDADIVLLMIDAGEGQLADQELKLLFYAFQEHYKAIIVLFNKQDIVEEYDKVIMDSNLEEYKHLMDRLVSLEISCKTGKNIGKVLPLIEKVWKRHTQQLADEDLTAMFKEALVRKPLYRQGLLLTVSKAKQIKTGPITLIIYVNLPQFFEQSQLAYLESVLRDHYDLKGVPVRFMVRKR